MAGALNQYGARVRGRETLKSGSTLEEITATVATPERPHLLPSALRRGTDYTDAWFVGYTSDVLAAVWVGFDDPKYTLGDGQAGGVVAAPIWAGFMKKALWRQ
jgi:membrane peptidoglycan carboxypeptidase